MCDVCVAYPRMSFRIYGVSATYVWRISRINGVCATYVLRSFRSEDGKRLGILDLESRGIVLSM